MWNDINTIIMVGVSSAQARESIIVIRQLNLAIYENFINMKHFTTLSSIAA